MFQQRLPFAALVIGVGLLLLSWFWPALVGGRRAWTKTDAEQLQESVAEYHKLKYEYQSALVEATQMSPTTQSSATDDASRTVDQRRYARAKDVVERFAQAEERYRGFNAKLEQAKSGGQGAAKAMQWIGIGTIAVGILGYFSMRTHSGS